MALRVWLPLNGNLNNQGLSELTPINHDCTIADGKIGQCYSFNGSTSYIDIGSACNEIIRGYGQPFTIAFWIKSLENGTRGILFSTYPNSGNINFLSLEENSGAVTSNALRFDWKQNYDAYVPDMFDVNQWVHVSIAYDGDQNTYIYKNGVLKQTLVHQLEIIESHAKNFWLGNDPRLGGTSFEGFMNDFRIYDECLSQKQIKEISKGLIVHYQLKTPRAINNLKRNATYGPYNNFGSSGSTCTVVKTGETYNGADIWRMTYTPNETSLASVQSALHSHGVLMSGQTFTAETKYCYWTLFKPVSHPDTVVGGAASNIGYWTEIPMQEYGGGWYIVGQKRIGNAPEDRSDSIFTSFKTPSATSGTPIIIDFCCPHLVEGYDYILEEFDYIGTNPTYEVDSSGNGYNGTINGTLTLSDDTARYLGSTKFDTNTSYIKLPALTTTGFANSFTISCWSKITDMNAKMRWGFSDGNRLNIYPTGSVICCNTGNSANNPYQNNGTSIGYSQWNGGWHQFVMVADGTTNKLYVDGVYQGTAKTYVGLTGTQIYISGWDAGTSYTWTDGLMNDFRIYATALSDDDIKELYQTSAMVDNQGNSYTYEFKEE